MPAMENSGKRYHDKDKSLMPIAQTRNEPMQGLNSVDQLRVQDRNFSAEWYDAVGGQVYALGTAPFTVTLATERLNTAPSVYSIASNIVTLSEAGVYLFNFQVIVQQNGGSSAVTSRAWLEQDPATGTFTAVPAAITYFSNAAISASSAGGSSSTVLRVGAAYRFRVRLEESSGSSSLITLANGSSLRIVRLWQNG